MDNSIYRFNAITVSVLATLLSLWSVRENITENNVAPLAILVILEGMILYFIYKNKVWAMIVLLIYITADTSYQIFAQHRDLISLPVIVFLLIAWNLTYCILIARSNNKMGVIE
jgi:uncharacterized membrane protein YqjE